MISGKPSVLKKTTFSFVDFFEGQTQAWGIFEDRFGKIRLHLSINMNGSWSRDNFVLEENFYYNDGRQENRKWLIKNGKCDQFLATCDDCIGQAIGQIIENEIKMRYHFRLKMRKHVLHVYFIDRIIKLDNYRAVNRATMYKWGIKLGELSLFFEKK
ncbi:MAG: hypothetical protein TECD_00664 [Hyphomicrobiaceae bacterium hypho_1]